MSSFRTAIPLTALVDSLSIWRFILTPVYTHVRFQDCAGRFWTCPDNKLCFPSVKHAATRLLWTVLDMLPADTLCARITSARVQESQKIPAEPRVSL